jgi:hypothetical protein
MHTSNKIEISYAVDADTIHSSSDIDLDQYIKYNLVRGLATEVINTYPVEVTLKTSTLRYGCSDETHKMTLFIFSEQQMEKHDKEIQKAAILSLAADRALAALSEAVCH